MGIGSQRSFAAQESICKVNHCCNEFSLCSLRTCECLICEYYKVRACITELTNT